MLNFSWMLDARKKNHFSFSICNLSFVIGRNRIEKVFSMIADKLQGKIPNDLLESYSCHFPEIKLGIFELF
jgi:hypothetical protein